MSLPLSLACNPRPGLGGKTHCEWVKQSLAPFRSSLVLCVSCLRETEAASGFLSIPFDHHHHHHPRLRQPAMPRKSRSSASLANKATTPDATATMTAAPKKHRAAAARRIANKAAKIAPTTAASHVSRATQKAKPRPSIYNAASSSSSNSSTSSNVAPATGAPRRPRATAAPRAKAAAKPRRLTKKEREEKEWEEVCADMDEYFWLTKYSCSPGC